MRSAAEVETERLQCLRPTAEAGSDYARLFSDPAVERWLRPPPMEPFTQRDIARILERDLRHWQHHRFGPWILREKDGGAFAGRSGLGWTRVEGRAMVELPWSLLPDFQGRGLASESAAAALGVASGIGLKQVVALALVENHASRRVMERIGLSYERQVQHFGLPHVLYGIDLRVWNRRPQPVQPG